MMKPHRNCSCETCRLECDVCKCTTSWIPWLILVGAFLIVLLAARVANSSVVTDCFIRAVEQVESSGVSSAIGDNGRARGSFQFWAAAWMDVNRVRAMRGQERIPYSHATNRAVAHSFAGDYLRIIESRLAKLLNRPPTRGEVYAAFNCGVSRFTQLGASLHNTPPSTRKAVAKLETILRGIHNGDRTRRQVACSASGVKCGSSAKILTAKGNRRPA